MRILFLLLSLAALSMPPAFAQLGPAGVPGAPGLAPAPVAPAQQPPTSATQTAPSIPPACAKSKNVNKCVARQEARSKARAACKGKRDEAYRQSFDAHLHRQKK